MENGGGQAGIHLWERLEQGDEVLDTPGSPGGDDRYVHRVADGLEQLQVEASLDAVGVDAVEDDLAGAIGYPRI